MREGTPERQPPLRAKTLKRAYDNASFTHQKSSRHIDNSVKTSESPLVRGSFHVRNSRQESSAPCGPDSVFPEMKDVNTARVRSTGLGEGPGRHACAHVAMRAASSSCTATSFEIPLISCVTPYSMSEAAIVRLLCVTTMNCV